MESNPQTLYMFVLFMSVLFAALLWAVFWSLRISFGRRLARQAFFRSLKIVLWLALSGFGVVLLSTTLHLLQSAWLVG